MREDKKIKQGISKLEVACVLVVMCAIALIVYAEKTRDRIPPEIVVKENNLFLYDTDEIDFLDCVEINDESDYEVKVINADDSKVPGEKQIQITAQDARGNVSDAYIDINVISSEEWNQYVIDNTNNYKRRRKENEEFEELKGRVDYDAFHLAEEFIGMPGGCNVVAQAFINSYFGEGYNIFDTYPVTKEEAMPGDIIYYTNGGLGDHHYAVYLGGASALQGNIYGTTVLGSVYMTYGTEPQFKRLNGK